MATSIVAIVGGILQLLFGWSTVSLKGENAPFALATHGLSAFCT
jgi:hypothetical protein